MSQLHLRTDIYRDDPFSVVIGGLHVCLRVTVMSESGKGRAHKRDNRDRNFTGFSVAGTPQIDAELCPLIRRMSHQNPLRAQPWPRANAHLCVINYVVGVYRPEER